MRIVGGTHRGRVIRPPKGLPVRPTTDQAKEGLFNILMHRFDLAGAKVLDCFAGTGNMSYEFLSRGAAQVQAVDQNARCIHFIKETFQQLGAAGSVARRAKVNTFLNQENAKYDIIFMDPPYGMDGITDLIQSCFSRALLAADGLVILEHTVQEDYQNIPQFYELRKYGSSAFTFFTLSDS
ncbi:MAG TPA: 16S rRNA (guanine(966)-N(2))-methyltransferase RsmD [Bacteroidetes bacterium]|nr:16S rRNA (guanine(966)-N(2))-methyltransferase RsmD [Bacteroidota bacterium]